MKKLLILLFLLFPLSAMASDGSAYDRVIAKNELVCGVWPWPPYKEFDPNTKEWKGFMIDLYRRAFETLDIKVVFKELLLGNQVQDLNLGRIDAICDDGPWTMSAGKFVEFSDPTLAVLVYPFVRKDETRFKTRADFNNPDVHFIGIDGDLSSDLVHRLFPKAKFSSMPGLTDVSQLFLNVASKKADVAIADISPFLVFDKSNPGQLKAILKDKPLGMYKSVVSVKKGDGKMLGLVNQAIDNALSFGIVDEVLDKIDPKHEHYIRVRSKYILPGS